MNNASPEPKRTTEIIQFPRKKERKHTYHTLIQEAQKKGGAPCLVVFRAHETLYGLYGTGVAVAGQLRGLNPRADFIPLDFKELTPQYLDLTPHTLSRAAVEELVAESTKKYQGEKSLIFFADEEGPEALYPDEEKQIGEDI